LVNRIFKAQYKYQKPAYFQRDPAGNISSPADPEYGLTYAFSTLKQFPEIIEPELAKTLARRVLAKQFYTEANKKYYDPRKVSGKSKDTIKALKNIISKDDIGLALADAFKQGFEYISLGHAENVLKKFRKYINKEYISQAVRENLSKDTIYKIKHFSKYLSDGQIKTGVKDFVREVALKDNLRDISDLVNSTKSKFTEEELSDFFSGLFQEVKDNIQISEFRKRERKKQDAVLEFLDKFSSYIPRNKETESFYELLDIKKELEKEN
jgi:predicted RNA binding protein with dsRBD fold (UPF0201 family)